MYLSNWFNSFPLLNSTTLSIPAYANSLIIFYPTLSTLRRASQICKWVLMTAIYFHWVVWTNRILASQPGQVLTMESFGLLWGSSLLLQERRFWQMGRYRRYLYNRTTFYLGFQSSLGTKAWNLCWNTLHLLLSSLALEIKCRVVRGPVPSSLVT